MVALSAKHPDGSWRVTDPSLLTFEAFELAAWLDALSDGQRPPRLRFIEPNLSFESVAVDRSTDVRVYFELECRPAWAQSIESGGFWLDFPCSQQHLQNAAAELRQQLKRFPVRGTPDADD